MRPVHSFALSSFILGQEMPWSEKCSIYLLHNSLVRESFKTNAISNVDQFFLFVMENNSNELHHVCLSSDSGRRTLLDRQKKLGSKLRVSNSPYSAATWRDAEFARVIKARDWPPQASYPCGNFSDTCAVNTLTK